MKTSQGIISKIQLYFGTNFPYHYNILNENTQISGQFLYCSNIWFPDISALKTQVNAKSARAIQNAESPMAKWIPDFAKKRADWEEALKILSDGQGMCYS
ncbi:MAG: type secretion system protein TraC, partial [Bacteroidota bacterium]